MKDLTPEMLEKARAAKSVEELLELAKANHVELAEEQAKAYFTRLYPATGEVADDELENVSGGGCGGGSNSRKVDMHGYCQLWEPGKFLSQIMGHSLTMQAPNGEWGTYTITLEFLYSQELLEVCPDWRTCVKCRFYRGSDETCTNYSANF